MRTITVDPITRLEGHGKITLFLNDEGAVENCYFQIPELRGFEKFVEGMPVEEVPRVVTRICGVCPDAHHMASGKAVDAVYSVDPPPTAKKLREMMYSAHFVHSHIAHFYALAAPDFVMGPTSDPATRNVIGVIGKVGLEIGGKVLAARRMAQDAQELITGRATHPVWTLPGGVAKGITEDDRPKLIEWGKACIGFSQFSLQLFKDIVLGNKTYLDIILSDIYDLDAHYIGTFDENGCSNFYHGDHVVMSNEGKELYRYKDHEYLDYISEHVEPISYLKYPYLKKMGWKGFIEGSETSLYTATPLSRCNISNGMATPLANAAFEEMYTTLGGKPVTKLLACHWARLVEQLYAAERWVELAEDPEITSPEFRTLPTATPKEGVGIVEAPRGILTHHYKTDENGFVTEANLIVGTTNNNGPISMSIKKAAQSVIGPGTEVTEGLLNMCEMAFRLYDPCFSCATHTLPGEMPLVVEVYDGQGGLIDRVERA